MSFEKKLEENLIKIGYEEVFEINRFNEYLKFFGIKYSVLSFEKKDERIDFKLSNNEILITNIDNLKDYSYNVSMGLYLIYFLSYFINYDFYANNLSNNSLKKIINLRENLNLYNIRGYKILEKRKNNVT